MHCTILVEITPGIDHQRAAEELCDIAKRLQVAVKAKFQRGEMIAWPHSKPAEVVTAWMKWRETKTA